MTTEERKEYKRKYYEKNKDKYKKWGEKWHNKPENKEYKKEKLKEWRNKNQEHIIEYSKNRYEKNKEHIKNIKKEWREKNKEKILEYRKEYQRKRRENDPNFKLIQNIRNRINLSFTRNGYTKSSKTFEILGCSFVFFKKHIEKQFNNNMNWENQGEWHLDHIKPVSLGKNEKEIIELNHYTNFQPLWGPDNILKSNKF